MTKFSRREDSEYKKILCAIEVLLQASIQYHLAPACEGMSRFVHHSEIHVSNCPSHWEKGQSAAFVPKGVSQICPSTILFSDEWLYPVGFDFPQCSSISSPSIRSPQRFTCLPQPMLQMRTYLQHTIDCGPVWNGWGRQDTTCTPILPARKGVWKISRNILARCFLSSCHKSCNGDYHQKPDARAGIGWGRCCHCCSQGHTHRLEGSVAIGL
jgi:hypothetical protein